MIWSTIEPLFETPLQVGDQTFTRLGETLEISSSSGRRSISKDDLDHRTATSIVTQLMVEVGRLPVYQMAVDERALSLAASALGITPFPDVTERTKVNDAIGAVGLSDATIRASVRQAHNVLENEQDLVIATIDREKLRGEPVVLRSSLPKSLLSKLAGPRLLSTVGRVPHAFSIVMPDQAQGRPVSAVVDELIESAVGGRLKCVDTQENGASHSLSVRDAYVLAMGCHPRGTLERVRNEAHELGALSIVGPVIALYDERLEVERSRGPVREIERQNQERDVTRR